MQYVMLLWGYSMSLSLLNLKHSYTNQDGDDIIRDFLNPVLKQAVEYDRAVGFFSSSSLMSISIGIEDLVKNGGKIKLICSPRLSEEDIKAIKKGYEMKDIISNVLERDFEEPKDCFEKERLNILSHLIADGILDIKIAFVKSQNPNSLFHVKMGVIYDENSNFVAYNGSMNDSKTAFYDNEESIDVFSSLGSAYPWAIEKKMYFDKLWSNESTTEVVDFPATMIERIHYYNKTDINWNVDKEESETKLTAKKKEDFPNVPAYIKIRDYQSEAFQQWKLNNYIGIYDMATGTGKTYTALYSIVNLMKEKSGKLGIIICCPYQHLVTQWSEDLEAFGFEYIMGYSGSKQKRWKEKLDDAVFDYTNKLAILANR